MNKHSQLDQLTHPLTQINFVNTNQAYVIEASAGTGKTWTLERLFIKALLESVIDDNLPIAIENILVVTFTNDATDELKQRISNQLQITINQILYIQHHQQQLNENDLFINYLIERYTSFDYKKDINILTRASQNFDLASIYTIHGFCNKILNDYQFECNVNTKFELVTNKSNLIEILIQEFMRSQIINNKNLNTSIDTVFKNLMKIFNVYNDDLVSAICNTLPKDLFIINNNKYTVKYNIPVLSSLYDLTNPDLSSNKDDVETCKAKVLSYIINYIATKYHILCAQNNTLTFDELIQKVADAIQSSPQLKDKIFTQYPIAFIDEFQDTDALQWQIFSNIYNLSGNKRGNLIVVGDPKQAIYKFRGANIDTYINARNIINNKLELNANFRSHKNIMNFINQLFNLENQKSDIDNSYLGNGINYTQIQAMTNQSTILPTAKELTQIANKYKVNNIFYDDEVQLITITGATKYQRTQKLLNNITFEILMLLQADPTLIGKIAILVTKNKEASQLVQHLNKYGIKASELKLGNVFATTNAHELYNLLNALNDINNQREFIKAISGNIFNIPLQKLHTNIEKLKQRFFEYKQIWESNGLIALIYAILNDNAQQKIQLTNRNMANIWQLAELINKQSMQINNNTELLYWLKKKIDNADSNLDTNINDNDEELIRLDNDEQQIVISTQHKSKGLEYEILFCPFFKSANKLNARGLEYQIPFFSTYQQNNKTYSELVTDENLANDIINNENKEIHRLNYVALTRAKSRIYIYLKQHTYTAKGKYNSNEKPDKLAELFGYIKENPQDNNHNLFNYAQFFTDNPYKAIKNNQLFPGVCAYNRGEVTPLDLRKIQINFTSNNHEITKFQYINNDFTCTPSYKRQSYSALTHSNLTEDITDYFVKNEVKIVTETQYNYSILHDKSLKGAIFGIIFHELCENYPLNNKIVANILDKYNVAHHENNYVAELLEMIKNAFDYKILNQNKLHECHSCGGVNPNSINEFKFNLSISHQVSITNSIAQLIAKYFGATHPYTKACKSLNTIESGFLIGFIDLLFEKDGKYWVLDYKTNTLTDYTSSNTYDATDNPLIASMAEHHYYLQYLLYLVAVKRYLESKLYITDATELIGGAIYYFVRGIYTTNHQHNTAIVIDDKCQNLVRDIDELFKGYHHEL